MTIDEFKKMCVEGTHESGLYSCKVDGKVATVLFQIGVGFELHIQQDNDWTKVVEYLYDKELNTWDISESYIPKENH